MFWKQWRLCLRTSEAILNGVCLYLSVVYRRLVDNEMSSSDLGQATYFARRVLFEEGGACLAEFISEEIRGALSHYFWQFATAMYNVSRPEDAANFMDLLLRPQMKFLESKSDTAIEAQGDATDVNALTLLAELYAQRRNVAEAIHVMDTLENRLRVQSRWPASPIYVSENVIYAPKVPFD